LLFVSSSGQNTKFYNITYTHWEKIMGKFREKYVFPPVFLKMRIFCQFWEEQWEKYIFFPQFCPWFSTVHTSNTHTFSHKCTNQRTHTGWAHNVARNTVFEPLFLWSFVHSETSLHLRQGLSCPDLSAIYLLKIFRLVVPSYTFWNRNVQ